MAKNTRSWKPTNVQIKEYQRLAAQADKRLQRLEKQASTPFYSIGVTSPNMAYQTITRKIEKQYGRNRAGNVRFGQKAPATRGEIKQKMAMMQSFLKMQTSTKTGIKKNYEKRAKSLNKKYKTNLGWKQWATLFASGAMQGTDASIGSDTFVRAIAQIKVNADKLKAKAIDANNTHLYKNIEPKFMQKQMQALLNDDSIPWDEIFMS